jgi:DinB family
MGILSLLKFGCDQGGEAFPVRRLRFGATFPLDVGPVPGYFVAHECHHRGQIVMLARQLGHRLPAEVTGGLWQWSKRVREAEA